MRPELEAATSALADLWGLDVDELSTQDLTDTVLELQRLRSRLEATEAKVLARFDALRVWQADGAKNAAAWLRWRQHLPIQVARQRVRHARLTRTHADIHEAWADGAIDRTHVATLFGARTPRTKDAFDRDHQELLDSARTRGFVDFKRHCDIWEAIVDPDGVEQGAASDRAARDVHLSESYAGMWFGRMTFDPISGTIVNTTLSMLEQELFEEDWAEAKEQLGRQPMIFELRRTPGQRRADAMVEMATRARNAPADGRRPAPLFTVVVGYETFAGPTCELFNRTVVTPGTIAQWLDGADIERIVFDSPSRVIDVGATRRFYRGALRRAIEVRDRTCFHPTCDEVPHRPQVDHIQNYSEGGPTDQTNGDLGCNVHNNDKYVRSRAAAVDRSSPRPDDPDAGPDPPDLS